MKKKFIISLIIIFLIAITSLYLKNLKKKETKTIEKILPDETPYSSNIIENVYYSSKDTKGNEYIIEASKGEIDYDNSNIVFLSNVKGLIRLTNKNNITITSEYGKYNTDNFDTIFSKNVIINYLDNKISGEYLDFSIKRNSMIISKQVIYTNLENILKADIVEIDIDTKDTKIFMFKNNEKVNIKNR
tara:strand:- start:133 stop:696 length:564 start_codon:yes stop_codon:yes gene_type:complete